LPTSITCLCLPARVYVIDLTHAEHPANFDRVLSQVQARAPFAAIAWIIPARFWRSDQKALVAAIQQARRHTDEARITGPTAIVCPDFMALDWVGPVRASAISIHGKEASLEWTDSNGVEHKTPVLHATEAKDTTGTFIRFRGRRPRVDLL
jgi:hypothetical protein